MRLSQTTLDILVKLAQKHFGTDAPVRLFGSRTDDQARGGDIDIQIVAPDSHYRDEIAFLVDAEQALDERIDLRVQRNEILLIDEIAQREGVLISGKS